VTTNEVQQSDVARWLRPILPTYASSFAGGSVVNYHELLREDRLAMYSTGEKSAIALAAQLEDRIGVVREILGYQHSVLGLLASLSYLSREQRRGWLALLIVRAEELAG
jgi:hypothetical protein